MSRQDNFYFELTQAFNAAGRIAVLASGQAVVYYRLALTLPDGHLRICALAERLLPEEPPGEETP